MVKELACRMCKCINVGKVCRVCKSSDLTANWDGLVVIANPETSRIAKTLKISGKVKYALKGT